MSRNHTETVDETMSSDYGHEVADNSPLALLSTEVKQLSGSLSEYQRCLTVSLAEAEKSRILGGVRISSTTLALFSLVALVALALNVTLHNINASDAHILRANLAMAVLYLLIAISALNDLARGRTRWRTEREALSARTQDVAEQLVELAATRQSWVEELTRSQWTSETEKLKLQLVQQEFAAKQESLEQLSTSLTKVQADCSAKESEHAALVKELDAANEQCKQLEQSCQNLRTTEESLKTKNDATQRELDSLAQEIADRSTDLQGLAEQLSTEQSAIQALGDSNSQLQSEWDTLQADVENLRSIEKQLNEACLAENLAETQRKNEELKTLLAEIATNELVLLEQEEKLARLASRLAATQSELESQTASLHAIENTISDAQTEQTRIAQESQTKQDELATALQQRDQILAERDAMRSACDALRAECEQLTSELESHRTLHADVRREIELVRGMLHTTKDEYEEACARLAVVDSQIIENVASQIALAEKSNEQIEIFEVQAAAISANQAKIDVADADLLERQTAINQLRADEQELSTRIDWLLNQMGDFDRLAAAQIASKQIIEQKLSQTQSELIAAEAVLGGLHQQIEAMRQDQVQSETSLKEAVAKLDDAQAALRDADDQIAVKQTTVREAEQRAQYLIEKAELMADQIECRAEELLLCKKAVADLTDELHALEKMKTHYESLLSDSSELDRRLDEQRTIADALAAQVEQRQALATELETGIASREQIVADLDAQIDTIRGELLSKSSALESLALESEELIRNQMRLQQEVHRTEDDLNNTQSRLAEIETQLLESEKLRDNLLRDTETQRAVLDDTLAELARRQEHCASVLQAGLEASQQSEQLHSELELAKQKLAAAQESESSLRHSINDLTAKRDGLVTTLERLTSEVGEAEGIANQWQAYLGQLDDERTKRDAEADQHTKQLDAMRKQLDDCRNELEQLLDQKALSLEQCDQLAADIRTAETSLGRLQSALQRDESQYATLLADLEAAKAGLANCAEEQFDATQQLQRLEVEAAELETLVNGLRREELQLAASCEQKSQAIIVREAELKDLADRSARLLNEESQSQHRFETSQRELSQVQRELMQLQATQLAVTDELAIQNSELVELKAALSERASELQATERNCDTARKTLADIDQQKSDLSGCLDQLHSEIIDRKAIADQVAEEIAQAQSCLSELRTERDSFSAAVQELQNSESALNEQITDSTAKLDELEARRRRLSRKNKRLQQSLMDAALAEEQAQTRNQMLQSELAARSEELKKNELRLEDLHAEQIAFQETIADQSLQSEKLAQQLSEQIATIASIDLRVQSGRAAKGALEKSLAQLTSERESLVNELKQFESDRSQAIVLRAEIDANQQMQESIVATIATLEHEKTEQLAAIELIRNELDALTAERDELESTVRELERQISEPLEVTPLGPITNADSVTEESQNSVIDAQPQETLHAADANDSVAPSAEPLVSRRTDELESDIWATVQSLSLPRLLASEKSSQQQERAVSVGGPDPWALVTAKR